MVVNKLTSSFEYFIATVCNQVEVTHLVEQELPVVKVLVYQVCEVVQDVDDKLGVWQRDWILGLDLIH